MLMTHRHVRAAVGGALLLATLIGPSATAASVERGVQMLDACDGPSFDAAVGPGTCSRAGGIAFQSFLGQVATMGGAPAWRFASNQLTLDAGASIDAHNRGGEFHTFTEVTGFGGGCVQPLNDLLGLTPVAECSLPGVLGGTGAAPGGVVQTGPLAPGRHLFECLIHPWMRTTVDVD
jgi:hypothetical protein